MLGQSVAETVDVERQDGQSQLPGGDEGAPVEALDPAVRAPRPLGEDDDGIAPRHEVLHMGEVLLQPLHHRVELRLPDQIAVERAVPDPFVRHKDHLRMQGDDGQDVEVRLVVADIHRRLGEILSVRIGKRVRAARNAFHRQPRRLHQAAAVLFPLAGRGTAQEQEEGPYRESQHRQEEHEEDIAGPEGASQRPGHLARLAFLRRQETEHQRREIVSHRHHGEHAHDGHGRQRPQGRMLRHDEGADADEHDEGGQDHGVLERPQDLLSRRVFVHQSLGDEDGIVVPLTENEGREDDIDNVELQAEQAHRPKDPDPAHRERQESGDAHRQAQGQAQEEKDDDAAQEPDPVEIFRQHPRQRPRHIVHREAESAVGQCRPQRVHDISDLPVIPGSSFIPGGS